MRDRQPHHWCPSASARGIQSADAKLPVGRQGRACRAVSAGRGPQPWRARRDGSRALSKRTGTLDKRGEYADAGIPHYWIIDITAPVPLVACHQAGECGYQDDGSVTGEFVTTEPFPVRVNLAALR
jgi:hypothetical protein